MNDHTSFAMYEYNPKTKKLSSKFHRVNYADYDNFDDLPEICKSSKTKREFNKFKKSQND